MQLNEYKYCDLALGLASSFNVVVTEDLVGAFSELTGDKSPLHVNRQYALHSGFEGVVVHGCLVSSFFSTLIGMRLPGVNALLLTMNTKFYHPVYIGDRLRVVGTIVDLNNATMTCEIYGEIFNQEERRACASRILAKVRE